LAGHDLTISLAIEQHRSEQPNLSALAPSLEVVRATRVCEVGEECRTDVEVQSHGFTLPPVATTGWSVARKATAASRRPRERPLPGRGPVEFHGKELAIRGHGLGQSVARRPHREGLDGRTAERVDYQELDLDSQPPSSTRARRDQSPI
jgi:hypothetical protein